MADDPREEVARCERLLEILDREKDEVDWAHTQMELGRALWTLDQQTEVKHSTKHLKAALRAFEDAREVHSGGEWKEDVDIFGAPVEFNGYEGERLEVLENICDVREALAKRTRGRQGIEYLRECSLVRTELIEEYRLAEDYPQMEVHRVASVRGYLEIAKRETKTGRAGCLYDARAVFEDMFDNDDSLDNDGVAAMNDLASAFMRVAAREKGETAKSLVADVLELYERFLGVCQGGSEVEGHWAEFLLALGDEFGAYKASAFRSIAVDAYACLSLVLVSKGLADQPGEFVGKKPLTVFMKEVVGRCRWILKKENDPKVQGILGYALETLSKNAVGEEREQYLRGAVEAYAEAFEEGEA